MKALPLLASVVALGAIAFAVVPALGAGPSHPKVTLKSENVKALGATVIRHATNKGVHHKIAQVGNVIIENDVEVGSNTTIARPRPPWSTTARTSSTSSLRCSARPC